MLQQTNGEKLALIHGDQHFLVSQLNVFLYMVGKVFNGITGYHKSVQSIVVDLKVGQDILDRGSILDFNQLIMLVFPQEDRGRVDGPSLLGGEGCHISVPGCPGCHR